ncbi:MAG TPA: NADH-quinone oxidoreductase subunit N, partial [Micromonosporaceae bacterium]|nr:NADH-quinone oxidoreductase subunit N [Micromonosporaceae bacterium]
GLFAKITVLRALLDVGSFWLAVIVALVSVVGLAVYWRPFAALYRGPATPSPRPHWTALIPLTVATLVTAVLSVHPQYILNLWPLTGLFS